MTWLFDLGNSRLKCARLHPDGTHGEVLALEHDAGRFVQALRQTLPARAGRACLSSVASPALTTEVLAELQARFDTVECVRVVPAFDGVRIAYPRPDKFGVDRFLALLGARARGGAWLIAGVGTALTIDLLDAQGLHHGGRIAPSPRLMREALHRAAAQLPERGGDYAELARDTEDALASGCDGAALGLIERSLRHAGEVLGQAPGVLLHGGGADSLAPHLPMATRAPALVLEGMARWARAVPGPAAG